MVSKAFDLILVGSGFASTFFLHRALRYLGPKARILVLEAGRLDSHAWQLQHRQNASTPYLDTYENQTPGKPWVYNPGFGGSSNCWWACTPRMLPADFELKSRYGIGRDWPMDYDELEEYYCDAEELMSVSGPSNDSPFPRSRPYPQPPHNLTDPDKLLKKGHPKHFFVQPTARARVATKRRGPCCSTATCRLCPINAKFTIQNEMAHLFEDSRVTLELEAPVQQILTEAGQARGVLYKKDGREVEVLGSAVALGANALFNPFILQQSGIEHPCLGRHLTEQASITVTADLDGIDNFQGSTSITGHGYLHYDGEHRRERAAALIETMNIPTLRHEKGRWRQRMQLKFIFENLLEKGNRVVPGNANKPSTTWSGNSSYSKKSMGMIRKLAESFLKPLPVEHIQVPGHPNQTESHILCTTIMGKNPADSIVDAGLVHHQIRNLLVLGGSVFPTASPANPTLTLSALSLRAASLFFA